MTDVRVLLIGKGGREHALAWKLAGSPLLTQLYIWPGHAAMQDLGERLELPADASFATLVEVARDLAVDLVVSGPEAPLSEGLADVFRQAGIPVFGPVKAAAALEASKAFAKETMRRAGIPTAAYELAMDEGSCRELADRMLRSSGGVVLKASGLAAGKGVFVCRNAADVEEGLRHLYHTGMRDAARTVVVEQMLIGRECSYFTFIGAGGAAGLGFAVDFKRLEDDDRGPNTGGMGCYAPVTWLPADAEQQVVEQVVEPLLATLKADGIDYRGCLYVGLMWSPEKGPQVVEFNVRLGDPEAEVLAVLDDRDWLAVMAAKSGLRVPGDVYRAATAPLTQAQRAVAVVMASAAYPFGTETTGQVDLPMALFACLATRGQATQVFGAAVRAAPGNAVATGNGRVLVVATRGESYDAARKQAYAKVSELAKHWPAARWRTDIGKRVASEVD